MKPIASTRFDSPPHQPGEQRNVADASAPAGALQAPDGLTSRTAAPGISQQAETDTLPEAWLTRRRRERTEELQALETAATSRPKRVNDVELPLAGYVLARDGDGRRLGESDVLRLRTARSADTATRVLLEHGRGNVDADIARTNRDSRYRTAAAKGLIAHWDAAQLKLTPDMAVNHEAKRAAAAMAFQAGNCREHASVAALNYGRFAMLDGRPANEVVDVVGGSNHNWAEVRPHTRNEDAVVIDPWAAGPPVMAEDSRFGKDRSKVQQGPGMRVDAAGKGYMKARSAAAEYREKAPADMQSRLAREHKLRRNENLHHPSAGIWSPQRVLDDEFSQRALGKLNGELPIRQHHEQDDPDVHAVQRAAQEVVVDIKAMGVAKELGARGRAGDLIDEAGRVVDAARELLSGKAG